MQRNNKEVFANNCLQFADAILVFFAFYLSFQLRLPILMFLQKHLYAFGIVVIIQGMNNFSAISSTLLAVVPFSPIAFRYLGLYENSWSIRTRMAIFRIGAAIVMLTCWFSLLNMFMKFEESSRAILLVANFFILLFLVARHGIWRAYFLRKISRNEVKESVLLAGESQSMEEMEKLLLLDKTTIWRVVGKHDLLHPDWNSFQNQLHDDAVARVIIAGKNVKFSDITTAVEMCEIRGIEAWVSAQFMQTQLARPSFDNIHGSPMLVLRSTPEFSWELFAKAIIDRCFALIFIVITAPLWLLVAIGIQLQSPGPVFFKQVRAGKYGKPFRMWKFRSMVVGAEMKLEEVKAQMGNLMQGPVFKLDNDPRIFPLGHILRKYSIDEFPQMINVLKGDMSLVGPRPMSIQELPNIERSEHRRKLSVKPGLTCIWQVKGRNSITNFDDWVKLDLQYIDTWSLWLDIKLLFLTIPAVVFARGAK